MSVGSETELALEACCAGCGESLTRLGEGAWRAEALTGVEQERCLMNRGEAHIPYGVVCAVCHRPSGSPHRPDCHQSRCVFSGEHMETCQGTNHEGRECLEQHVPTMLPARLQLVAADDEEPPSPEPRTDLRDDTRVVLRDLLAEAEKLSRLLRVASRGAVILAPIVSDSGPVDWNNARAVIELAAAVAESDSPG